MIVEIRLDSCLSSGLAVLEFSGRTGEWAWLGCAQWDWPDWQWRVGA